MVMCNMESVVIPRPPAPPIGLFNFGKNESVRSKKSNSSGFRLMENQDDTGSVYSIYKQKIDSMFESDSSSNTKNSVQARIEKMFTDVAIDSGIPVGSSPSAADIGCHTFSVDYLGSVPLQEKVTSLTGLQKPLRDLYFAYKRTARPQKTLSGKLEISGLGLKVHYQGDKGDLEQLNSFPTIAVWSAVKFVIHQEPKISYAFLPLITDPDNIDKQQLFKTLDNNEKKYINAESHSPLFAVVMRKIGVHKQLECHGFVCQTSEDAIVIAATLYKSLMVHMKAKEKKPKNRNGVTCMSATSSNINDSNLVPVRPPRKKRSTTSSTISDGELIDADTAPLLPDTNSNKPKKSLKAKRAPKAPEIGEDDLDAILPYEEPILPHDHDPGNEPLLLHDSSDYPPVEEIKPQKLTDKWNTYMSNNQKQIAAEIRQVMSESSNMGLKRVKSLRKRSDDGSSVGGSVLKTTENSGDILTKVTIPRSGSFLNAGGLTRYKSKIHRSNGQATGGSPLGFNELFNEFRLQENLHSINEILGVIINPEGMSFNALKPIYKEFLLKLAVTLTKEELYQRSKCIMRRQKKKLLRRSSSLNSKKRHHQVVCSKFNKRLKHVFQKFKLAKNLPEGEEADCLPTNEEELDAKLPESSISTSSYDTRQFRPKEQPPNNQITRKQSYRKRASDIKSSSRLRRDRTSTSEESDFLSLRRSKTKSQSLLQHHNGQNHNHQNRNSSSGYVSYSECSYDSDTCTCVSADKCYCSLGTNKLHSKQNYHHCKSTCRHEDKCYCTLLKSDHLTACGCDTDSCTDSNKCYCTPKDDELNTTSLSKSGTIFEQLKQRGFIPSSGSVTTPPNSRKQLSKKNSNTKSTRSLEYMHNPTEKYYEKLKPVNRSGSQEVQPAGKRGTGSAENLALDYELFTVEKGRIGSGNTVGFCGGPGINHIGNGTRIFYGRSVSESGHGFINEQNSSMRLYNSTRYAEKRPKSSLHNPHHHHEALSVKKSAEIAALFTDIQLSQTTDIARQQMSHKNHHHLPVQNSHHLPSRHLHNTSNYTIHNNSSPHHHNHNSHSSHNRQIGSGNAAQSIPNRMVMNSLYTVRNMQHGGGSISGKHHHAGGMYSTKNGLYTIQSQSDDSRGSSNGAQRGRNKERCFVEGDPYMCGGGGSNGGVKSTGAASTSLENSLGYLP